MKRIIAISVLALSAPLAMAQQPPPAPPTAPTQTTPTQTAPTNTLPAPAPGPTTTTPATGANSFTEDQARKRIEEAGFTNVTGLTLDAEGIWRGQAERNGVATSVGLDYQGNVTQQ